MNTEERLKRLLEASSEKLGAIDGILEGRAQEKATQTPGPLLLGMTASAKLLGVSRATLWRMTKAGLLQKVEVLPGSFRLRRADLEAVAAGEKSSFGETGSKFQVSPQPLRTNKQQEPFPAPA